MSREFLNRNYQQDQSNSHQETPNKKIDLKKQLGWINNQKIDQGWGLPVQMFAREEEEQQASPEIQMKPDESLSNAIESAIQARFGTPVIQRKTEEEPASVEAESATSYLDTIEPTNDDNLYTAFYNDIAIYTTPESEASENLLEVDKKYQVINKCKIGENNFYEVKKEGEENSVGWIKDYEYVLYGKDKTDREDKLNEFKDWLDLRLTEAEAKTGDEQINFVQGILGLIEKESANIAKDPPEYPNVESLDKSPSYSEANNPDLNVAVPHELISITRDFINITELTPVAEAIEATATETGTATTSVSTTATTANEERIVGGSRHSNNDWNTRLKVPQYRTQSDNLSVPEATCNVTTMAMTLERLGNGRNDVVKSIEAKLSAGIENPNLDALWKSKSKEYLEKITSYEKGLEATAKAKEDAAEVSKTEAEEEIKTAKGEALVAANKKLEAATKILNNKRKTATWRYLRGNKGSLIGKEDELSKIFKENAQMEDLLDFYLYLTTSKVNQRTALFNNVYNDKLPEQIKNPEYISSDTGKVNTERIDLNGKKVSHEQRAKIKNALDKGCSVVISVYHKGKSGGTHIISVQSISSEGLILDDPYGGLVDSYRHGEKGDFFAGKGKKNRTANKNTVHSSTETDYTKRDFTAEAAQNLEADESRGKSKILKWEMINESKSLIYYIMIYENN